MLVHRLNPLKKLYPYPLWYEDSQRQCVKFVLGRQRLLSPNTGKLYLLGGRPSEAGLRRAVRSVPFGTI